MNLTPLQLLKVVLVALAMILPSACFESHEGYDPYAYGPGYYESGPVYGYAPEYVPRRHLQEEREEHEEHEEREHHHHGLLHRDRD
jgi:hypothetical protein